MAIPVAPVLPHKRAVVVAAASLVLVLAVSACGGSDSPSGPPSDAPHPTAVTLSASTLTFASLGVSETVEATVWDQFGGEISSAPVTWSTSDGQVASVSGGVVMSTGNGTATVTATAGVASATVGVTVQQVLTSLRVSPAVVMLTLGEAPTTVEATAVDANGWPGAVGDLAWASTDAAVVSVDASGVLTPVSVGWAVVRADADLLTGTAIVNVRASGFPGEAPAMRALHLGGNWLGNQLHAGTPHPDYWRFVDSLDVNWVGVSVALHYGASTDPLIRRAYEGVGIRTFSDDVLHTLISSFRSRGIDVYVTLAFEPDLDPGSGQAPRWLLGQPWLEGGFTAEQWPWLPTHPDHASFVAAFWSSYTEQAVHFARIAEEAGASLFSLGTETDRLFRTRAEGLWVTEFGDEIRTMVSEVRSVFSGKVTYDQVYSVHIETDFFGSSPRMLWQDAGLDAIGLSAYFRLLPNEPQAVTTVDELQTAWEDVLGGTLAPLRAANPSLPIYFTEIGYVDDIRAPADPTVEEFQDKQFSDANGNGLDDGEETQANIYEALFRALRVHSVVDGAFLWDHAMDADAEIEHEAHFRSTRVRGKLAEEVVRLAYRGSR